MTVFSVFLPVVYTLLQILSIALVGFLAAKSGPWSKEFFQRLSGFMVRVGLPIYFFTKVSQSNPHDIRESLFFPFFAIIVIAVNLAVAMLVFRCFPKFQPLQRVGVALATFGNSGMIPVTLIEFFPLTLPVIGETFGVNGPLLYVGTYLLVGSPLLWSVGNFLMVGTGRLPRWRELLTPPLFGIIGGLAVVLLGLQPVAFNPRLPFYHLMKALESFGQVTYPTILVCLGAMIGNIQISREERRPLLSFAMIVSAIRFVVMPLIFMAAYWTIFRSMHLSPAQTWVIFLEMHIPPATNLAMMAAQAGINEDQVSSTLLITYLVYLLILPLHLLLFLRLMGIV